MDPILINNAGLDLYLALRKYLKGVDFRFISVNFISLVFFVKNYFFLMRWIYQMIRLFLNFVAWAEKLLDLDLSVMLWSKITYVPVDTTS